MLLTVGSMMAAAGVDWVIQLFKYLGPLYLAEFMRETGTLGDMEFVYQVCDSVEVT